MGGDDRELFDCLRDAEALKGHIANVLYGVRGNVVLSNDENDDGLWPSSVLFLIGPRCGGEPGTREPCVILNKRSSRVRQPGDLCFPGGSISYGKDAWIGRLLGLPGLPLGRWRHWPEWKARQPENARRLAILLATGLREGFEEMRLNPLGIGFLGPLPAQRVSMFQRIIHPLAVWVSNQRRFTPNWEVETVVSIPMRNLLDPSLYAQYHLYVESVTESPEEPWQVYPCFVHGIGEAREILWGATYHIVMTFLTLVFGFVPPRIECLHVVRGVLDKNYFSGLSRS